MYELPFQRAVERQARPKAVFGQLNPGRGLGSSRTAIGLAGHNVPTIQKIGVKKLADGGMLNGLGQLLNPIADVMNVDGGKLDDIPTQDFDPQSGGSGLGSMLSNEDLSAAPLPSRQMGDLSMGNPSDSDSGDDSPGGFQGWLKNKHFGGITGDQYLRAGLTALTGVLGGIAGNKNAQARIHFAGGGQVGGISPDKPDDQSKAIAMNAIRAIAGKSPNPQQDIQAFVAKFGQEALQELVQRVRQGGAQQQQPQMAGGLARGGMLSGPGDGQSDSIPANGGSVALGDGEYVLSADDVSNVGNGSSMAGKKKLDAARMQLGQMRSGAKPNPVADHKNPLLGVLSGQR